MKNINLNPGGLIGAIGCGGIAALILYVIINAGTPPEKLPLKLLFLGPVIGGAFAGNFLWALVFPACSPSLVDGASPDFRLFYRGTQDDVRIGDRVRIKERLQPAFLGQIFSLPATSDVNDWCVMLDDGSMIYGFGQPNKKVSLIARGEFKRPNVQPK